MTLCMVLQRRNSLHRQTHTISVMCRSAVVCCSVVSCRCARSRCMSVVFQLVMISQYHIGELSATNHCQAETSLATATTLPCVGITNVGDIYKPKVCPSHRGRKCTRVGAYLKYSYLYSYSCEIRLDVFINLVLVLVIKEVLYNYI